MLRSLVGSEMCIRDRNELAPESFSIEPGTIDVSGNHNFLGNSTGIVDGIEVTEGASVLNLAPNNATATAFRNLRTITEAGEYTVTLTLVISTMFSSPRKYHLA